MSDTRSQIGAVLDEFLTQEQLSTLVDKVLEIEKGARGWCPNCNKAVMVQVADAKAVTGAIVDLLNQSHGRPQDVKPEAEGITFTRKVVYSTPETP